MGPRSTPPAPAAVMTWLRRKPRSPHQRHASPFDSVTALPAVGYVATEFAADTANAAIGKWYDYSMWSHLLTSAHHVYAIRGANGELGKLEILAYYCREVGAACYTIRYKTTRPRPASSGARK